MRNKIQGEFKDTTEMINQRNQSDQRAQYVPLESKVISDYDPGEHWFYSLQVNN